MTNAFRIYSCNEVRGRMTLETFSFFSSLPSVRVRDRYAKKKQLNLLLKNIECLLVIRLLRMI